MHNTAVSLSWLAATRAKRLSPKTWSAVLLTAVILVAALLRFYHLRWDGDFGAYPHPDERHLANTMSRVTIPWRLGAAELRRQLLDPDTSPLNPRRLTPEGGYYDLAYGTLPVYIPRAAAALLATVGLPQYNNYDGFFTVGRVTSVIFALITVLLTYGIGATIFGRPAGLLGAAFLALSVTHIQLSHFMTVDLALAMFTTGGIYWAIHLARRGGWRNALLLGLSLGGAMACKVSGATLLAAVAAGYGLWLLRALRQRPRPWARAGIYLLLIVLGFLLLFGTFEFYVLLNPQPYLAALASQSQMVSGENDWPFTRQYVNTTPYLYHLNNLVRYGVGVPLGVAMIVATLAAIGQVLWRMFGAFRRQADAAATSAPLRQRLDGALACLTGDPLLVGATVLLAWLIPYFAYIGRFEVKFIRYLLPMVPPLSVLAGWLMIVLAHAVGHAVDRLRATDWATTHLYGRVANGTSRPAWPRVVAQALVILLVLAPTAVYAVAFLSIYRQPHTWLDASRWLYANAPRGARITAESWDDALPVDIPQEGRTRSYFGANVVIEIYHDLPSEAKLQQIMQALREADYIALATPRLYGAVRRLPWRYPVEIRYYELLFTERLGFELAHASMSYPTLWGITFVDDGADESFSVYDHPKALIYRKVRDVPETELRALFADALRSEPVRTRVGDAPPVTLPVPQYRKTLMLDVPVNALPAVNDYAWNRLGSSGTIPAIIVWLLVIGVISAAAWPLAWFIFRPFADRGYLLAKPLGLILVAYLTWLPASLGFWHYTVWAVLLALGVVAFLSYLVTRRRRGEWHAYWQRERANILRLELLFLAAFAIGLLLRLGNPDLWHPVNGGEKPMEFGFLNAILRSPTMPPYDPFFSGGYVNYYYYGLFVVSVPVKLSGLLPSIGFNLIIATLVALTATGAYAVAATLVGRAAFGLVAAVFTAFTGPLAGALTIRGRGGFGEVVAAMQRLADPETTGGLARTLQGLMRWLGPQRLPLRSDWFWDASRAHGVYENTITEFPFWSFLFADLHPHTINIPFTILAIALALRLASGRSVRRDDTCAAEAHDAPAWLLLGMTALVLGALAIANSWDFPTFYLLAVGALALAHWRDLSQVRDLWRRVWRAVGPAVLGAVILAPLSLALYFTFFTHFQAFVKGIGRVRYPTEVNYYLGFFGFFLFFIATYSLWRAWHTARARADRRAPSILAQAMVSAASSELTNPDLPPLPGDGVQDKLNQGIAQEVELHTAEEPSLHRISPMAEPDADYLQVAAPEDLDGGAPPSAPPAGLEHIEQVVASDLMSRDVGEVREVLADEKAGAAMLPSLLERVSPYAFWWGALIVGLLAVTAARLLYPALNLKQAGTFLVMTELLYFGAVALATPALAPAERFAGWLGLVGLLVSLGVEVIYIRDHLGDTWYRMNTIFKFYIHTWVILAIAAAASLGLLWRRSGWLRQRRLTSALWWVACAVLSLAVLLYPIPAIQSRWRDRFPAPPAWGTLDGLAYMETATYNWDGHELNLGPDYAAIQWLNDNIRGTPIIMQAPYGFYRENGVRIAANTGFPTVLNPLHENEQRYDELIGPRHRDADNIYKLTDPTETIKLLAKYAMDYVYVGPFERAVYPAQTLAKFDAMIGRELEVIYDVDGVRIYRVSDTVRREHGGYAPEASKPVVVPTVAPQPTKPVDQTALKTLERAADANPENAGLQFELGDRYRQAGRYQDAIRVFERSLKYNPQDVAMYHTLGDTYMMMNQPDKALQQYIRATEAVPTNAPAWNKLGIAYLDRGLLPEAVVAFRQAVELEPGFAEAAFHLGEAYERQGDRQAARDLYKQVQQIGPDTDWAIRAAERLQALGQ